MRYGGKQDQGVFTAPDDQGLPSVIDERYIDPEEDESSSVAPNSREQAFIPSQRVEKSVSEVQLELRRTEDGRLALLCYESLEQLIDACGNQQPWISVYSDQVDDVRHHTGADVVLWNAALPEEVRKGD